MVIIMGAVSEAALERFPQISELLARQIVGPQTVVVSSHNALLRS
jgi:hypothetical protein